ncbi:putative ferulic acid esterase [Mycena latifolia]|nr:putative ferulic acid esterase [Mycena latifolia]
MSIRFTSQPHEADAFILQHLFCTKSVVRSSLSESCAPALLTRAATCLAATTLAAGVALSSQRSASPVAAVTGTAGCGTSHIFPGLTQYFDLTSGNISRSYSIHLPSTYDVDTGLSECQYSAEKIMVYPYGLGGAWAGANYSEATVPQDLAFVSDLLNDIHANYCIDDTRVYATGCVRSSPPLFALHIPSSPPLPSSANHPTPGMSIGGGFVNTIACSPLSSEFAAFAAGSGSFYTSDNAGPADSTPCTPAHSPLPMLEIHGGADPDVAYAGGVEPAIPDWCVWEI